MTIVYVYARGKSAANGVELRYSLRSIEQFGRAVDRVIVVGYCPEWLSNEVVKLPYFDGMPCCKGISMGDKMRNIMANVVHAVDTLRLSECLVSMDDHFYIKEADFSNYPHFVRDRTDRKWGYLLPKDERDNTYNAVLSNTRDLLEASGLPYLNFAIHRNMHVYGSIINEFRSNINEMLTRKKAIVECFAWWNNIALGRGEIEPTIVEDFKPRTIDEFTARVAQEHVFSTPDFGEKSNFAKLLDLLYPNKSIFEL